jgi:hypothetical protein
MMSFGNRNRNRNNIGANLVLDSWKMIHELRLPTKNINAIREYEIMSLMGYFKGWGKIIAQRYIAGIGV